MAKTPKSHGEPWTPAHDAQFRKVNRENTPTRAMGFKLGRTEASIYGRATALRESLKQTNQSPYNRRKK